MADYPYVDRAVTRVNFGALPSLPDGYSVAWHDRIEHYIGHGPGEWESAIYADRFDARQACFLHYARAGEETGG